MSVNRVVRSEDGLGYDAIYDGRVYPFNFERSAWTFLLRAEEDDLTAENLTQYPSYPEGEETK